MSALTIGGHLPGVFQPFTLEPVRVLDPRFQGRSMTMRLMTQQVLVPDETTIPKVPGTMPYTIQKIVCSPMFSSHDPNAIYEVVTFTVADPRFAPSTVQVCFTPQEALAFRQTIKSADAARKIVASSDNVMRLKCYFPGCSVTSSKMKKIKAHFLVDHSNIGFEQQKVKVYRWGGPGDPSIIRSSSTGHSTARHAKSNPASNNPVTAVLASQSVSAVSGIKRRRGPGVTDLNISVKAPRKDEGSASPASAVRATKAPDTAPTHVNSSSATLTAQNKTSEGDLRKKAIATSAGNRGSICVCFQPDDGRPKIECDNGEACLLRWYHIDCVGLTEDDLPSEDDEWYCPRCMEQGNGGAFGLKTTAKPARDFLQPRSIKDRVEQVANDNNGKGKAAKYRGGFSSNAELPKPSPSVYLNPWTAPFASGFVEDPENVADFGLETLEQARATLLALSKAPIGRPKSPPGSDKVAREDRWGRPLTAAGTLKTPNSRSWSEDEEQALIDVVQECVEQGLSGEPLWQAAHPMLVARGVNRPIGGMKMRWCRGLRQETRIDERRKKNQRKMITALQGPKVNKDPNAPKKGRFKVKGVHDTQGSVAASSPIRKSMGNLTPSEIQTAPIRKFSRFDIPMRDVREDSPDSIVSDYSDMSDMVEGIRPRARSV